MREPLYNAVSVSDAMRSGPATTLNWRRWTTSAS